MSSADSASRAIDLAAERPFRVGHAVVDPASRDASFNGEIERLQPQNLKVLIALAGQRGRLVSRDALIEQCWDGRFVGDDVINRSISMLRRFADQAGGFAIETIPRAGYRLVEKAPGRSARRSLILGLILVLAIAAALGVSLLQRKPSNQRPNTLAIALLPFGADGPGTQSLARETRDSITHMLSVGGYPIKLSTRPTADYLISGDLGTLGDKIVATVRIEDTARHAIIFSHRLDSSRSEAALLPDRIGADIAASLSSMAALLILERRHPSDPAVVAQLFTQSALPGQDYNALQAYQIARRIAPTAPNSAIAQIGLAFHTAFALTEIPPEQRLAAVVAARRAAIRARQLAPEFGDVYAPWCLLHEQTRLAECEAHLRAGLRVDPDAPFVDFFLSGLLDSTGRQAEELQLARLAFAHNPYVPVKIALLVQSLDASGESAEAEALYRQGRRWFPDRQMLPWARLSGLVERGDFDRLEAFERTLDKTNWLNGYDSSMLIAAAVRANSASAVRAACPSQKSITFRMITCLIALARVGDLDSAFAMADLLYPSRLGRTASETERIWLFSDPNVSLNFLTGPGADALRDDPRYVDVARRVGLLEYWRKGHPPDFCRASRQPICRAIAARN